MARSKEFIATLQPQGLEPDLANPVELRVFLAAELAKWSTLVDDSGAMLDGRDRPWKTGSPKWI